MKPGGISCREVVELVTAYLDGALAPEEQRRVHEHLALCDPCVRFVAQLRATTRAARALELEAHPDREALRVAFQSFPRASGA